MAGGIFKVCSLDLQIGEDQYLNLRSPETAAKVYSAPVARIKLEDDKIAMHTRQTWLAIVLARIANHEVEEKWKTKFKPRNFLLVFANLLVMLSVGLYSPARTEEAPLSFSEFQSLKASAARACVGQKFGSQRSGGRPTMQLGPDYTTPTEQQPICSTGRALERWPETPPRSILYKAPVRCVCKTTRYRWLASAAK